jgi:hypothetical protein
MCLSQLLEHVDRDYNVILVDRGLSDWTFDGDGFTGRLERMNSTPGRFILLDDGRSCRLGVRLLGGA